MSSNDAHSELANIANAERFNRERFRDDTEFADWAQSRCRHALTSPHPESAAQPAVLVPIDGPDVLTRCSHCGHLIDMKRKNLLDGLMGAK